MNINYQKELDKVIDTIKQTGQKKSLLLHTCCAPCSSYCLEYLTEFFDITILYYNPNVYPEEEYVKRIHEQSRLIQEMPLKSKVSMLLGEYNPEVFFEKTRGLERVKEGGERGFICYEMRLREAANVAKKHGFDYFTTSLSISPHKNAERLNEIGRRLEEEYGVNYLYSDFKKRNGYKRSIELSKEYDLYRQSYCGCVFSKQQAEEENRI